MRRWLAQLWCSLVDGHSWKHFNFIDGVRRRGYRRCSLCGRMTEVR